LRRLEALSPSLVKKFVFASGEQRRSIVLIACELAIQRSGLDSEDVNVALASMAQRLPVTGGQVARIAALVERLDERYFRMQKAAEAGRASPHDYLVPFSQARAASALVYALDQGSMDADLEAIYEAVIATELPEETARALEVLL
jgi:hypothetical protein